jgi:hypothetical protein
VAAMNVQARDDSLRKHLKNESVPE